MRDRAVITLNAIEVMMSDKAKKGLITRIGARVSATMSDVAAHPLVQIGVVIFCLAWFALGLPTDLLTAALSILAITLTQMVLNRQNDREAEAHQRDVAMHAKLDDLLISSRHAHNELAGIEDLPEDKIVQLKGQYHEATDDPEDAHRRMPPQSRD